MENFEYISSYRGYEIHKDLDKNSYTFKNGADYSHYRMNTPWGVKCWIDEMLSP